MAPMTSSSPKPSGKSRQAPRSWMSTWAFRASTSRPCCAPSANACRQPCPCRCSSIRPMRPRSRPPAARTRGVRSSTRSTARPKASRLSYPSPRAMAPRSWGSPSTRTAFPRTPRSASRLPGASSTPRSTPACVARTSRSTASSWPLPPTSPKSPRSSPPCARAGNGSACAACSASPT